MKAQRQIDRIIAVITIAAMMITAFTGIAPQNAYAATEVAYKVTGGNIYFDTRYNTVTKCDNTVTEIFIPEEIEGVAVTGIQGYAFSGCTDLSYVYIPASIEKMQSGVFRGCSKLLRIDVDSNSTSYKSIDGVLYTSDMGLYAYPIGKEESSYTVEIGTKNIWPFAFWGAHIERVSLPQTVTEIGQDAFCGTKLRSIELPDSVTTVGDGVFTACKELVSVKLSQNLRRLSYNMFNNCPNLNAVDIGDGTSSIGGNAFYACESLKNISLPQNLKTIGSAAFAYCASLETLALPNGMSTIENGVFLHSGIKHLVIPDGVTTIVGYAFGECSRLESLTIPASVNSIGENAFRECKALVITAPEGSFAYEYAVKNGIDVIASETGKKSQSIDGISYYSKKLGCEPFNLGASTKTALTYSSSNPTVAAVSSDGTVTVKGEGTAVITITAEETPYYKGATKEVTVKVIKQLEQQINAPDSITKLTTDSSFKLSATSSEGAISYVSGNNKVAEISANGTVTIRGAGKAVITVKAAETEKYKPATKEVAVTVNKAEQTIKAAADSFVKELKDGSFNLNASAEGVLTYSSNNTSVADVSSAGVVSLKGFGSTVITITAAETDKYKTAVKKVNVTVNKPPQTILGADSFTKEFGCGPFGLGASAEGALSYESSNNNIVTVSSSGVVTVKSAGTAVITVIAAETDKYARTTKSVLINIKKDDQDIGGDIAFYKTYGCEPFDLGIIAQGKCTFTSSNVKVASVSDKGIVTVNGAGVAVITITSAETGNYNEAVKTVTVTVEKAAQTIQCKESISKTFSFETFNIGVISATDCIYQSSNKKLVTVNEFGDVTLKNPGKVTVTITAVESDNYKSAVKKITISSKLKKPVIKVKALKGSKAKLSWASVAGAKGYKVYIYDKAKKKYVHRLTKRASVKSVIHRGLKKGVTYKYKIRAYRKVNGKTVYSPYSAVKSVKAR